MAAKIANVMARAESHIKEQAEETMDMLGIPVSCCSQRTNCTG